MALGEQDGRDVEESHCSLSRPLPAGLCGDGHSSLRGHHSEPGGFLFASPSGGPMVRTMFMHAAWRPAANAVGLPKGTSLHALRHFCTSALNRAGLSVRVVSERLGHTNTAMTLNVYAHLCPMRKTARGRPWRTSGGFPIG
jgi:integrase